MIPEKATVYVCAIESEKLRLQNRSAKFFFPQIKNILHFTNRQLSDIHLNWPFVNSFWTFFSFIKTNNERAKLFQIFLKISTYRYFENMHLIIEWSYAWTQLVRFPFKVWRSQKSKFGLMHTCTSLPIIFTFWQICISRNSES